MKRANFGSKLEQRKAEHEMAGASRRSNIATSPRRDATTSRRWVNHYKRQQAVTSRRQREIYPPSLKAKEVQNWRHRKTYGLGHENQNGSDIDLEEEPVICIVSSFWIIERMFYILHISIFLVSMFQIYI